MGRTTRTCSLIALALLPSLAEARRSEVSPLAAYARGRVADRANDSATSVASYAAALTLASDATVVAFRAYRAGVDAGNYALALRGAQTLDRVGVVPPDAQVLLYIASLRERDWAEAGRRLDRIAQSDGLDFLAPALRGWLMLETAGPVPAPAKRRTGGFEAESDALLMLARGDVAAGTAAFRTALPSDPFRAEDFRLAAAATLSHRGDWATASTVVAGGAPALDAARARIAAKQRLPNAVTGARSGTAFILQRAALDLTIERSSRAAVTLARLATFADPQAPQPGLVLSRALGVAKRPGQALAIVADDAAFGVQAATARSLRIEHLEALGRIDEALAATRAGTTMTEIARMGDIEARRGNHAVAATLYRQVVEAQGADKASSRVWHALGHALEQSGDWKAARPALERAVALAPDDPNLLNQLGYALAERGEALDRSVALLTAANAAAPNSAPIIDSLGWALFRSGRLSDAITMLERARELDPAEPEIAEHLGDVYWAAGRRIEARYAWASANDGAEGAMRSRLATKLARGLP